MSDHEVNASQWESAAKQWRARAEAAEAERDRLRRELSDAHHRWCLAKEQQGEAEAQAAALRGALQAADAEEFEQACANQPPCCAKDEPMPREEWCSLCVLAGETIPRALQTDSGKALLEELGALRELAGWAEDARVVLGEALEVTKPWGPHSSPRATGMRKVWLAKDTLEAALATWEGTRREEKRRG